MAEGAHLSANAAASQPTIFEVLAASNLSELLRPVVTHLTDMLLSWKPQWHAWLWPVRRLSWPLAILTVDGYFLRHYDALFAENFYGLKRTPVGGETWRLKSLFLLLVSQSKQDIESWFESLRYDVQHGAYADQSLKSRFIRIFVWLYPVLHFLHVGANLFCHFFYVIGRSRFPTVELLLAGAELTNASPDADTDPSADRSSNAGSALTLLRRWISVLLTLGIFLLQFLHSRSVGEKNAATPAVFVPPPPQQNVRGLPSDPKLCPLCLKTRRNSAALTSSGIVFCYSCIRPYVTENGSCPITKCPASVSSIIRIFK